MRTISAAFACAALVLLFACAADAAKIYKFEKPAANGDVQPPPQKSGWWTPAPWTWAPWTSEAPSPTGGKNWDFLVLAVQRCSDSADWTMHGLWPTDKDNKEKPADCGGPAFSKSAVEDLWPNITKYWETCSWSSNTEEEFLSHEWQKHGSCFGTGEHTYFQTALNIFMEGSWRHECYDKWSSKSCQVKVSLPNSTNVTA